MAVVAVCRLAILTLVAHLTLLVAHLTLLVAHLTLLVAHLTLLEAHRMREQVKVQVQRSGKMKTWGGSRTQRANILNSQIVFCENSTCPFGPLVDTRKLSPLFRD